MDYFEEHTKIKVMKPEGTYLVWLDFSAYDIEQPQLDEKLQKEAKVVLNDGAHFGKEGKSFATSKRCCTTRNCKRSQQTHR